MEPTNHVERKEATRNFLLVNGLLTLLILLFAYLLFASPMNILNRHLQSYMEDENQQRQLNTRVQNVYGDIRGLVDNDKDQLGAGNDIEAQAALATKKANLEDNIRSTLENIKRDSAQSPNLRPIVATNYENYIQLLDVTLNYRKTIDYLKGTLSDASLKASDLDNQNKKLTDANNQLQTQNAIATSGAKAAGGGGGGGGGDDKTLLQAKDAQISDLTQKYNACNTALSQYKQYRGLPSTTPVPTPSSGGGVSSASVLFDEAGDMEQKAKTESSPSNRDCYLFAAQQIMKKIKATYPDQAAWKAKNADIESTIKKFQGF
jgi:hypothetical protein